MLGRNLAVIVVSDFLLRTAVETAISGVHKLLRTGGVRPHLLNIVVLAVADGLSVQSLPVGALGRAIHL